LYSIGIYIPLMLLHSLEILELKPKLQVSLGQGVGSSRNGKPNSKDKSQPFVLECSQLSRIIMFSISQGPDFHGTLSLLGTYDFTSNNLWFFSLTRSLVIYSLFWVQLNFFLIVQNWNGEACAWNFRLCMFTDEGYNASLLEYRGCWIGLCVSVKKKCYGKWNFWI